MKKYISIIVAILALFATSSCKDYLEKKPVLSQSDVLSLSSLKNLNLDMVGAYGNLIAKQWYGANFILRAEMPTANGKKYLGTVFDTGRLTDLYNINFNAHNGSYLWGIAYSQIYMVNEVLDAIKNLKLENTKEGKNITAECLFLRALAHFDLVRVYARPYNYKNSNGQELGVPVIIKIDASFADKPKRNTVKEVYDQVIKDLTTAESLISEDFTRPELNDPKSVVSKEAIQALLCRVYLYSEQWQKCADYATKVINSGKYSMWTVNDIKDAACYTQDVPKGGEIIFEAYSKTDNSETVNLGFESLPYMTSPNGYPDGGAPESLKNLYGDKDIRGTLFTEKQNCFWTLKYKGKGIGNPDFNNTIILRLSEMYLNRAEAALKGHLSGYSIIDDLKTIALNRNAEPQSPTLQGIFTEERKEFAWEAHLWFDLARNGLKLERGDDYVGSPSGKELNPDDFRWVSPIPVSQIEVDSNLKQNPGY